MITHVTEKDESGKRHVTEQPDEEGSLRVVTLGLRLRDKTVEEAIIYDRRCPGNGDQGVYLQTL